MGQFCWLHSCFQSRLGHDAPPCCDCWTTLLLVSLSPVPQVLEQAAHVDHSPTVQSTESDG